MSIIGHRAHYAQYPNYRGTIVGMLGSEWALVDWDAPDNPGSTYEPVRLLTVLDETVTLIKIEPDKGN